MLVCLCMLPYKRPTFFYLFFIPPQGILPNKWNIYDDTHKSLAQVKLPTNNQNHIHKIALWTFCFGTRLYHKVGIYNCMNARINILYLLILKCVNVNKKQIFFKRIVSSFLWAKICKNKKDAQIFFLSIRLISFPSL